MKEYNFNVWILLKINSETKSKLYMSLNYRRIVIITKSNFNINFKEFNQF